LYWSSVLFAASLPATTSTGALGKYDFMYAKTWLGWTLADASHRSPDVRGLSSADPPMELSWAHLDEALAVSQLEARLLQALSASSAASHSPRLAFAEIYNN
jgi:hypothetical protein